MVVSRHGKQLGSRSGKGDSMTTLVLTYLVTWASIGAYVLRLIMGNRRLIRRIGELNGVIETTPNEPVRQKCVA
jgi:CcmD family protein